MTADPYVASAELADPGSWNQYSYVLGDPINLVDPTGEKPESIEGGWLPRIGVLLPRIFGSGIPGGFSTWSDYLGHLYVSLQWRQDPQKKVRDWDFSIAAAIAAAAQKKSENETFYYPHHLQVVRDCYERWIGSVRRVREYEVRDEQDNLMAGRIVVQEYNYVVQGSMTSANTSWMGARFQDHLARGFGSDIVMYQQFTVQVWGIHLTPGPVPIMVREMDGRDYGTLGIKMEAGVVWINGNDGRIGGQLNWCK